MTHKALKLARVYTHTTSILISRARSAEPGGAPQLLLAAPAATAAVAATAVHCSALGCSADCSDLCSPFLLLLPLLRPPFSLTPSPCDYWILLQAPASSLRHLLPENSMAPHYRPWLNTYKRPDWHITSSKPIHRPGFSLTFISPISYLPSPISHFPSLP